MQLSSLHTEYRVQVLEVYLHLHSRSAPDQKVLILPYLRDIMDQVWKLLYLDSGATTTKMLKYIVSYADA
jgi:hypothetical protein